MIRTLGRWSKPSRRLFLVTWVVSLALLQHAWSSYGDAPEILAERGALVMLSIAMVLAPWGAGPAVMVLLQRMSSGGVNLPYAEYWFTGERRPSSLDRLSPYLDGMGTLLTVFLAGVLALFVGERIDPRLSLYSAVAFLGLNIAFLGGVVWWVRRVMAAFPAPEPSTRGIKRFRRRR